MTIMYTTPKKKNRKKDQKKWQVILKKILNHFENENIETAPSYILFSNFSL